MIATLGERITGMKPCPCCVKRRAPAHSEAESLRSRQHIRTQEPHGRPARDSDFWIPSRFGDPHGSPYAAASLHAV